MIDDVLYSYDGKVLLRCPPQKTGALTLPNGVEIIGENAFDGCYLTSVQLNDGVKEIHDNAFSCSFDLEDLLIPDSVETIGVDAFSCCDNLTVHAVKGSFAAGYCGKNGINHSFVYSVDDFFGIMNELGIIK